MYQVYRYEVFSLPSEAKLENLPAIPGIDFMKEIQNFNETPLNCYTLKIGEKHIPTAAVWTQNGAQCYSSDEAIVQVAENGTVTAIESGTAYLMIKMTDSMYSLYKYIVK